MSLDAEAPARAGTAVTVRLARVRRGSLAVLVLIVAGYLCYTACLYLLPRQRG